MNLSHLSTYKSLVDPILNRVKTDPEQLAFIFINDDETGERVSMRRLHLEACGYAYTLNQSGIKPGDIVIIALRHCKALIPAFWGVLYTGAIPSIFPYKGGMTTSESYIDRLVHMVGYSGAQTVITLPGLKSGLERRLEDLNCRVLVAGDGEPVKKDSDTFSDLTFTCGEQMAYLQYTSGTTGMQKGVMLSHRAILGFVRSAARALAMVNDDVVVNWLPLCHDFGVFAGLILPLACGIPTVLISPFKWLRNPLLLLWIIDRYKGTISFLPNSGHNHTVGCIKNKTGELDGLDLGSLRVLINGAEPVLYRSQEMFLKHFAPYGFRETALAAGYGMAENTLSVTLSPIGVRGRVDWVGAKEMQVLQQAVPAPPHTVGAVANVSSGVPLEGMEVAVMDDSGDLLPERRIGEIFIRSHSLFSGYHGSRELTGQVMVNGWYRTGDLGYMAEGELYVCGRKRDLIIVGGSNIHPEDLEAAAGSVPGIRPDRIAAFGIMDEELGTEKPIMICEAASSVTDAEKINIERKLRREVFNQLEITLGEVHLVKKGWVVRSQAGKIARGLNREKYIKDLIKK